MSGKVGVRELKDHLSAILERVRSGETVTLTRHNRPIAYLVPFVESTQESLVRTLAMAGRLSWAGGKPRGAEDPPDLHHAPAALAVLEDRR